ncbi:endo-1,4-beta-xylanase xylA, putative (macronuclear) [Tetrahymena thermophila SB210]|uniref:Endo-1,4-beta-xylanase xylA, putative n=1 Tax=Tetrahymena thermophila (strain SB210) TaxID=312017 RepID=I7LVY2_TETTS|nr:endo-1,4-beta-xylanase xylA, putative [Tetrahymena thermophila SB210]EAS00326.2 endo-1,4-beta-xylanase xylA, putative [Tetrahymena thermophila SB210]|eukprot:XP_001020571.2 endo-1,4-beta-xylanase xylA, putative [Tetrahymena thermophila SB210]
MYSNNSSRFQSENNSGGDEGSNMTFAHNKKGGPTLESVESPRFNDDKIRLSTKSSQQNNSKNQSALMGQYSNDSSLMNSQIANNSNYEFTQSKGYQQGNSLTESLQRYKNMMNQIQQKDNTIQSEKFDILSDQKVGIKPSTYIERKTESTNIPLTTAGSNFNMSGSQNSSIQSTQKKLKQSNLQYGTNRLEDIEDIENYDSSNNEESGVADQLRKLREKDYFEDTESEQSFDRELNTRLKMIEVKKKLMNTSVSSSNFNSAVQQNNLNQHASVNSSINSSQAFNQLESSNSKLNVHQGTNKTAGLIIGGKKNQNILQNNSLYNELIEKKSPQIQESSNYQNNKMAKIWENHLNQFLDSSNGGQKQLNMSGNSLQNQQNNYQIQQDFAQPQQNNTSIDEHNISNQSSMLRASRLDQSEQLVNNNQQSVLGINSRFQNSTLQSRYSFIENDQSRNQPNKSLDNSDKKNISRTIYNSSRNNNNMILVGRFIGSGQNSQHIAPLPIHNKSNSNINISNVLTDNITDRKTDNAININQKNSFIQEKNVINKSNFLDDQSIIHQKGQSIGAYQLNENNEISQISALDHIQNVEEHEYQDQQGHMNNFQYQYQDQNFQHQNQTSPVQNQEELTEYSQSAISNSEIKLNAQQQNNLFAKKNNFNQSKNNRQNTSSHQNSHQQNLNQQQVNVQNLKYNLDNLNNKQVYNQEQDNQVQKFVTLSQDFDEQSLYIQKQNEVQIQQNQQEQMLAGQKLQRNLFQQDSIIDNSQDENNQLPNSKERQFTSKFETKSNNESFVSNNSYQQNQYYLYDNQKTLQSAEQAAKSSTTGLTYSQKQQSISSMQSPPNLNNYNFRDQQHFEHEIQREKFIEQIEEVISNQETKQFLIKHFAQNYNSFDNSIYFVHFLDLIASEFGDIVKFDEDIDKIQFEEILQTKLTTNDEEKISLNALQIFTKDGGLRERITSIAQSIKNDSKQREKDNINRKIFQEINSLSKILEQKSKELAKKEKSLIEREQNLKQKEQDFKSILKGEYDVMIFSLDEAVKERSIEVNKKIIQLERNLKNKMKIIETKSKEIKQITSNSSANADKFKSKLAAQEKQAEFLKIKTQDLEKKYVIEQEKNATLQSKYDNLLKKHKDLEKYIKELQGNMQQLNNLRQQRVSHSPDANAPLSYSESGIESQFRQSEGTNKRNASSNVGQNADMPSPIKIDSMDEDELKMGEITINEINQALHNGINQWNNTDLKGSQNTGLIVGKKKIGGSSTTAQSTTGTALKKKSPIGPMGASTTTDEEVKVLMSVVQIIMNNIKTTLPLIINMNNKGQNDSIHQLSESCIDLSIAAAKNSQIDVGEFLYPCFNNLVSNLVEIIPSLLVKQCSPKHLYGIVDLMFRAISFKFRYTQYQKQNKKPMQNSILSEEILESTRNIIKSHQDHINEIMMNPKKPTELTFIPQTAFWKRKIKVIPKKSTTGEKNNTALSRLSGQTSSVSFQLFSNEDVQKEMLQVFKQYMDHSELLLKRKVPNSSQEQQGKAQNNQGLAMVFDFTENSAANEKSNAGSKSLQFENQKYTLMTRIDLQIMTLILQVISKESINAIQSILIDISNENENLNDFLRSYIINIGFVEILVWRMIQSKDDALLIELSTNLMWSMCTNGSHYNQFIQDISEDNVISKLIVIFEKYSNNYNICEKLSVIIQRISYHNSNLKERLTSKQIQIFKNKLVEAEYSKEDGEFLVANLRTILQNLE